MYVFLVLLILITFSIFPSLRLLNSCIHISIYICYMYILKYMYLVHDDHIPHRDLVIYTYFTVLHNTFY